MQELSRGLMERRPSRMLDVLVESGLIERLYGELEDLGPGRRRARPRRRTWTRSAGALCRAGQRMPQPAHRRRPDRQVARAAGVRAAGAAAGRVARHAGECGIVRHDRRYARARRRVPAARTVRAAAAGLRDRLRQTSADRFRKALRAAADVDAGALASLHRNDPAEIPRAVRQARVVAVSRALHSGAQ